MLTKLRKMAARHTKGRGRIIDFAIVGVCKGGTESAVVNLGLHPEIDIPNRELNFFNRDFHLGVQHYRRHFDYRKRIVGEKTPHYYMHEKAIARMQELCPRLRLLMMVRDPIRRLFSHWNMLRDHYLDLVTETGRYAHRDYPGYENWLRNFAHQDGSFFSLGDFVERSLLVKEGFYMDQIDMLLKYYPRHQLHVAISEHVRANMDEEYAQMLEFLGAKAKRIEYKGGVHSRKYAEPINEEVRRSLEEIYRPYNDRLYLFIGKEIEEWTGGSEGGVRLSAKA